MARHEFELKGKQEAIDSAIALFVNSKYQVHWETKRVNNVQRKVLVIEDLKKGKGDEQ